MIWLCSALLSLLTTNLIFTKALGTSTMMAAAKSRSSLVFLAVMMTLFSALSCMLVGTLYTLIPPLSALSEGTGRFILPLVYTLCLSLIYILVLLGLYSLSGRHFVKLKKYVHLSAFNCAVMGALYLAFSEGAGRATFLHMYLPLNRWSLAGGCLFGVQMGLGFLLAAWMFSAVRTRLYAEEVPATFRGFPAVLVYIGLLSMAVHAITA